MSNIIKPIQTEAEKVLNSNNSKAAKIVIVLVIVFAVISGIATALHLFIAKKKKEARLRWPNERC